MAVYSRSEFIFTRQHIQENRGVEHDCSQQDDIVEVRAGQFHNPGGKHNIIHVHVYVETRL